MQEKRGTHSRGRDLSGSCAYVGRNSPEHQCIQFRGISEGEKYADDIRTACKFEIQIWEPKIIITTFLILGNRKLTSVSSN